MWTLHYQWPFMWLDREMVRARDWQLKVNKLRQVTHTRASVTSSINGIRQMAGMPNSWQGNHRFGISLAELLQKWEDGRLHPPTPNFSLIGVACCHPYRWKTAQNDIFTKFSSFFNPFFGIRKWTNCAPNHAKFHHSRAAQRPPTTMTKKINQVFKFRGCSTHALLPNHGQIWHRIVGPKVYYSKPNFTMIGKNCGP